MAVVMRPLTSPAIGIDGASAAVAAQPIEEKRFREGCQP